MKYIAFTATILSLTRHIDPVNQAHGNTSDRDLVMQVLEGNKDAFRIIIQQSERLVAQIVWRMVSHTEDRRDLAQDIYLKAFRNLPGYRFQSKLSTWIGQIAYNACTDYLRKKKLILQDIEFQERIPGNIDIEKLVFQKEQSTLLRATMEKLPPVYKTLVSLFHQEELDYEEIAAITKMPLGTVKNYLFRARKKLKEILMNEYNKEDL